MRTAEEWYAWHHRTKLATSSNPPVVDLILAVQRDAYASAIEEARMAVEKITRAELMLAAGEMTVAEWRAAVALRSVAALRIRALLP